MYLYKICLIFAVPFFRVSFRMVERNRLIIYKSGQSFDYSSGAHALHLGGVGCVSVHNHHFKRTKKTSFSEYIDSTNRGNSHVFGENFKHLKNEQKDMENTQEIAVKPITMKLSESTIERVNNIKKMTDVSNRTRIMATGVKLLEHLLLEIEHGGKVYIKKKDGSEEIIHFLGL